MNTTEEIKVAADVLEQKCRDTKYELLFYPVCETAEEYHQMLHREAAKSAYASLDVDAEAFLNEAFTVYCSVDSRKRKPLVKYLRKMDLIRTRFLRIVEKQKGFVDVLGRDFAMKLLFALMVYGDDSNNQDVFYRLGFMFHQLVYGDHDAGRIYDDFYGLSRWPVLNNYIPPNEKDLCDYRD